MISLVVVDDDPIARKGIISSIEWRKFGFQVIGEAANGRDAFALIKSCLPDIVITDIKMPVEDGLRLSQNIVGAFPQIKIMILSGYEDFDYARQAIKIGVKEYLLKPVDADDLLTQVQKLGSEIEKERMLQREESIKNDMIKDNLPQMRTRLLNDIIGGITEPVSELRWKSELLGIRFEGSRYQLMIADLEVYLKEKPNQITTVIELIEKVFSDECQAIAFCNEQGSAVAILNLDRIDTTRMNQMVGILKDEIRSETEVSVNIFLGGEKGGFEGIPESYQEAVSKLKSKINNGTDSRECKKIVAKAISFVQENYQNKISIENVIKSLYVSPNYFSKIFKTETGLNFIDYLNRYRIEKAKQMMTCPDLKIYEIAEKVGYQNYKYFNYIFNKYIGCSPQKYYYGLQGM